MSFSEVETIRNFYDGAEIFITGGSGFIGRVLIEKLLRSCTRIKAIYLLMRPKKNKSTAQRILELSDCMLFDLLREENPDALQKLHVIEGDVMKLNLGICESDLDKLKACSVIFHSAATVRFDDPLKSAILLNTRGTREMCKLAQTLPHLKALVHVSTAYIQPKNFYVKEKIYPAEASYKTYIDFAENLDDDLLDLMTLKLTKFAPNTYTFTKHMAEHVCNDFKKDFNLPIAIFRPSIVSAAESQPVPGWCDNFNGPTGLVIVGGLGLSHVTACKTNNHLDTIPVDVCVKGMIVAALKTWKDQNKPEIPIFNATSIRLITFKSMALTIRKMNLKVPSVNMFGIPYVHFTACAYYAWLICLFRNLLPALFVDGVLKVSGNKPKLMKIQRIIYNTDQSLKYFYQHIFKFDHFNFIDLNRDIPEQEKDEFSINEKFVMNNQDYYFLAFKMCKIILLGESEKDNEKARRRFPYIFIVTRTINALFFYAAYKLLQFLFCRLFLSN